MFGHNDVQQKHVFDLYCEVTLIFVWRRLKRNTFIPISVFFVKENCIRGKGLNKKTGVRKANSFPRVGSIV